jgi:hypothetical protein
MRFLPRPAFIFRLFSERLQLVFHEGKWTLYRGEAEFTPKSQQGSCRILPFEDWVTGRTSREGREAEG